MLRLCPQEASWMQTSWDLKPHLSALHEQEEYLIVSTCSFMHTLGPVDLSNESWVTKGKAYKAEFRYNTCTKTLDNYWV